MEWDFLVIGGGVAGLTAGAALSQLGRVTVWEAEDAFGYHASGRSAAMFEENYGNAPVRALTRASRAAYEAAGTLSDRGLFLVGLEGQETAFHRDVGSLDLEPVSLDHARSRVPLLSDRVTRVAQNTTAQDVDTDAVLQRAAKTIRAAGGKVQTGRRVTGLSSMVGGWYASADQQITSARTVVIAAGAWADDVADFAGAARLGLQPLRRSVARVAAPAGQDVSTWPMLLGVGEAWYAKPDAGAMLVSSAEEAPAPPGDAFADDLELARGMDFYGQSINAPLTRPMATWGGLRSFTPDRSLAIGPSDLPGLWWCAGQGGYGFQTAPAAAQLLADLISGRSPKLEADVVAALDPGRFL